MTPAFLNPSTSPSPKEEEDQQKYQFCNSIAKVQASSSSSSSSSSLCGQVSVHSNVQDHGGTHHREVHQLKYQPDQATYFAWQSGSSSQPICENASDHHGLKFFLWKKELGGDQNENHGEINGSTKWMPSKMRMMRKMMNSVQARAEAEMKLEDQKPQPSSSPLGSTDNSSNSSSSNSNNPTIRVCADCNTTKTPLWRSGPRGPKSLCNACGIRQRKARRAMAAAAAAAAANGATVLAAETPSGKSKTQQKEKRSNNGGHVARCKKRSKIATASQGRRKLCFEDFLISMSENLAFHHVFPQDEKEAAILLMALSCGLVHG